MNTSASLASALLPARVESVSSTLAAAYGVPRETVALAMLNILGGVISASTRVRFAGTVHPLGTHMALIDAGAKESDPLEAELIAPLLDEVQRLRDLQAKYPHAQKQLDEQVARLNSLQPGAPETIDCVATMRQLATMLGPDLLQVGTPASGRYDGLSAPVLMPMLNDLIEPGNESAIKRLQQSFAGDPGTTATILGSTSLDAAKWLISHPLVQSLASWPLMLLPKHGSPFTEVDDGAIEQAREQWRDLIGLALRHRYRAARTLNLSASAMLVVDEMKKDAERRVFQSGSQVACLWMVSALIRLGATIHALGEGDEAPIQAEPLNAVKPLLFWAADMQKALFPGRISIRSKRRIPARATTNSDFEKANKLILRHPKASDRKIRRMLPNRPAGYWTLMIRSARANAAPNFAAEFTATAATTAAATTPK